MLFVKYCFQDPSLRVLMNPLLFSLVFLFLVFFRFSLGFSLLFKFHFLFGFSGSSSKIPFVTNSPFNNSLMRKKGR